MPIMCAKMCDMWKLWYLPILYGNGIKYNLYKNKNFYINCNRFEDLENNNCPCLEGFYDDGTEICKKCY